MNENYEIKFDLPEHALGDFFARKAAKKMYAEYAAVFGEEETQKIFTKVWKDMSEIDYLESIGRYEEAEEIEDELDEYIESIMADLEALEDSDYGESWS
jgi:hypothetical protein